MLARLRSLREAASVCAVVERAQGNSRVLLVCEHASYAFPPEFGDLDLPQAALQSHIAWDPGALALARLLSARLDATLIHQAYSRLIYDCNRAPDWPAAMPSRSEIFDIPGNRMLSREERLARTEGLYIPFHAAISRQIAMRKAVGRDTALVTVHSFTPVYHGETRAVEIGILHDADRRLADAMLEKAGEAPAYKIERNEPYGPQDGVTHSLVLHGLSQGLRNVMIEVRNDLLQDEAGQEVVAGYLAGLIQHSLDA